MQENKLTVIRDYIIEHSKFVFPIIVIALVAFIVPIALHANRARTEQQEESGSVEPLPTESAETEPEIVMENVPLAVNEDGAVYTLVATYYNAMALGDCDVLTSIYDELTENELLRYREMAKYLEYIPTFEIYSKPGYAEGSTLVYVYYTLCFLNHEEAVPGWQMFYVCDNGQGELYIKNEKNFTEEEKSYIRTLSEQADVVDLNNRVTVEYNNLMEENPQLLAYIGEFGTQVDAAIGVALAEQNAGAAAAPEEGQETEDPGAAEGTEGTEGTDGQTEPPAADNGPQYATATTTVNVRSSDSEQADRLGKVAGGTRVQVQEVRVNGWSKIVFEGGDGYIKSEYLQMEESAEGQEVIGSVTAKESINIRSAASTESERLGVLAGGESLELLANEGEWCKVKYNGKVGYVKTEFVTQ